MEYIDKDPIEVYLMHYGKGHLEGGHSGRYPWGSGDDPYQHSENWIARVKELRKSLPTYVDPETGKVYTGDTAVAKYLGISTTELKTSYALAKDIEAMKQINRARALKESGLGATEIGRKMGVSESTVRGWLDKDHEFRTKQAQVTAEIIKERIKEDIENGGKGIIDIGAGVELDLGISRNKLDEALVLLEAEGYVKLGGRIPQVTDPKSGKQTTLAVIAPPDTAKNAVYNYEDVRTLTDYYSDDNGDTFKKKVFEYPASMDISRLQIRYAEQGGTDKDGVIELRPGVQDLSLGDSAYSQVRILVDGDRYLKGMAVYSNDLPDGIDVLFNTNKHEGTAPRDVLKKIKDDPENPFGSTIKEFEKGGQYHYIDNSTGEEKLGLINKTREEGEWNQWKDKLPAQFLSKQQLPLAQRQLNLAIDQKRDELNDILACTNPTVKKSLLNSFAEDCDSASVHLYAAALPRQKYQVILPCNSLKDTEVYAPNFENGEKVALVRFPHGATFEIPILTVNNKQPEAKSLFGNVKDAVAINSNVASRLSGADFDGDTVMVIPTNDKIKIKNDRYPDSLKGFDPKAAYGTVEKDGKYYNSQGKEVKIMTEAYKQKQMGVVSNLITDMTIKGAPTEDIVKAVKHSMVVIDAVKHKLDYKSSETVNEISRLKKTYQDGGGVSTLISAAKSETTVDKRQGQPKVNVEYNKKGEKNDWYDPNRPEGALIFQTADDEKLKYTVTKTNKRTGETIDIVKNRKDKITKMAKTDDARSLISTYNSPMERLYATYANSLKAMANEARKISYTTIDIPYNASAAKVYEKEVKSLKTKLEVSMKNTPRERAAQTLATSRAKARILSNPDTTEGEAKKIRQQEITKARAELGASRKSIDISDREWEAIQAGAVSPSRLSEILKHTDTDTIKEKATPRNSKAMTDATISRVKRYASAGYTQAEIGKLLGISASTVSEYVNL